MNPIKGMMAIISDYGIGKTTLAIECNVPVGEISYINDNSKDVGIDPEDFKFYYDLINNSVKMSINDLHQHCLNLIDDIPESKVIIWDTWTQFAATFEPFVVENSHLFRTRQQYKGTGTMIGGQRWQDSWRYEGGVISLLKKKCDLLILTFHLKQDYLNGKPVPGRHIPGHTRAISNYADLRIWLTPTLGSQTPIGLVTKNISKRSLDKEGLVSTLQVLPPKVEKCNWRTILDYWNNPVGDRELKPYERPSKYELSLIEGTLTPEERELYKITISIAEKELDKESEAEAAKNQEQTSALEEYVKNNLNGVPSPLKLKKVKNAIESGELEYNGEITGSLIASIK